MLETPLEDSSRTTFAGEHEQELDDDHEDVAEVQEQSANATPSTNAPLHQADIAFYFCSECNEQIPESERDEHQDWHFAKQLQAGASPSKENTSSIPGPSNSRPPGNIVAKSKRGGHPLGSRGRGGGFKAEKGQSRLAFG